MKNVTEYTCGFLICRKHVALIQKNRPQWQSGFWNGIGGHIEAGETPHDTQVREFHEEAGILVPEWTKIAVLTSGSARVHFFKSLANTIPPPITSMTDEPVEWHLVNDVLFYGKTHKARYLRNLRILLSLALDDSGLINPIDLYDDGVIRP